MTPPVSKLSDAEWRLMNCLWKRCGATAREIHDDVSAPTGWAYTTVKTMLDRLVEKGVLGVKKVGKTLAFRPLVTQDDVRQSAVRTLVDRVFEGAAGPVLHHLLREETISAEDRDVLRRLLDRQSQKDGRR